MNQDNNWFIFAEEDLKLAKYSLKEKIYNQVCFHSQQGVEKMLKGYLRQKKRKIPKTHLLDDLLNLCIETDSDFSEFKDHCLVLDKYYIPTRYPDALPGMLPEGMPGCGDAKGALRILKEVMQFVYKKSE